MTDDTPQTAKPVSLPGPIQVLFGWTLVVIAQVVLLFAMSGSLERGYMTVAAVLDALFLALGVQRIVARRHVPFAVAMMLLAAAHLLLLATCSGMRFAG